MEMCAARCMNCLCSLLSTVPLYFLSIATTWVCTSCARPKRQPHLSVITSMLPCADARRQLRQLCSTQRCLCARGYCLLQPCSHPACMLQCCLDPTRFLCTPLFHLPKYLPPRKERNAVPSLRALLPRLFTPEQLLAQELCMRAGPRTASHHSLNFKEPSAGPLASICSTSLMTPRSVHSRGPCLARGAPACAAIEARSITCTLVRLGFQGVRGFNDCQRVGCQPGG